VAQPVTLATNPFVTKYLANRTWSIKIAAGVRRHHRPTCGSGTTAACWPPRELHQVAGELDTASEPWSGHSPPRPTAGRRPAQCTRSNASSTDFGIRPRADTAIPLSAAHWRIARV
jgi:hypothetical protein